VPACSTCGFESGRPFRFCPEWGTERAAAPSREQRKTVTVLFCDLTGSTALGETLDPERLRALLASYFERMRAIVERHGGTVEKFIGDAVMAVFGVPVVHEDDALRAVRSAVEMRDTPAARRRRSPRSRPRSSATSGRATSCRRSAPGRDSPAP
jgi:class 3 adenylate cyclase